MKNLAAATKRARKARRWTQAQLAERLGVSQGYVSLLEAGGRPVPEKLVPRLRRVLGLSAEALPARESTLSADSLPGALAALGYQPFGYLRGRAYNPADVLLSALRERELSSRVVEGLPWLALHHPDLDWGWLVERAKVHDVQNRLGFVLTLARAVAERQGNESVAALLRRLVDELEPSRLEREDTLCRDSMPEAERRWLRHERPPEAQQWHLLTSLSPAQLPYAN
jgi:transcriptional regulator with XRE-family HTH domain